MRVSASAASVVMGFSGIIAQILLVREILVVFNGNELCIGLALGNWLLLEALGAFVGGHVAQRVRNGALWLLILQLVFAVAFVAAVPAVRITRTLLLPAHGQGAGVGLLVGYTLLVLAGVSVPHGALFPFCCKIFTPPAEVSLAGRNAVPPCTGNSCAPREWSALSGKVYALETVGMVAGGLSFYYLFVRWANSIVLAMWLVVLNAFLSFVVGLSAAKRAEASDKRKEHHSKRSPDRSRDKVEESPAPKAEEILRLGPQNDIPSLLPSIPGTGRRAAGWLALVSLVVVVAAASALALGLPAALHDWSLRTQWKEQKLVSYENSVFGNVALVQKSGQCTVYTNGVPTATMPVPDIMAAEEFVHYSLLLHPNPRRVLVIGGGIGGILGEALRHPEAKITYTELDPLVVTTVEKHCANLVSHELKNPRVTLRHVDGRAFVRESGEKFDAVLLGTATCPYNLQVNRYFTKEFSRQVRGILAEDGILALRLTGSLAYLSDDQKRLNVCVRRTLLSEFESCRVIPGDPANIMVASCSATSTAATLEEMARRAEERGLTASAVFRAYMEYRLDPQWLTWFEATTSGVSAETDTDFQPYGIVYGLAYWVSIFSPSLHSFLLAVEAIDLLHVGIAVAVLACAVLIICLAMRRSRRTLAVAFAIGGTGLGGTIVALLLSFAFQSVYGYLFHELALLVTLRTAGAGVGALAATRLLARRNRADAASGRRAFRWLLATELAVILFAVLLAGVLERAGGGAVSRLVFQFVSFLVGLAVGCAFPLASAVVSEDAGGFHAAVGTLYAADLLGGWIGGVSAGAALLPALGIAGACMTVVFLKVASLVLLLVAGRRQAAGGRRSVCSDAVRGCTS